MTDPAGEDRTVPEQRIADLVHDLRTPLTIVHGFADLLRKRPELDEAQRAEFLERIVDAAREMTRLLDDERATRHADGS